MMKKSRLCIFLYLLAALLAVPCYGQRTKSEPAVLPYVIHQGDTIFLDNIRPAVVRPGKKTSQREWRKYYMRVHNFSKAYPYALCIAKTIRETDSLFIADNYTRRQQDRYLANLKNELLREFEPIFRGLTLQQGLMMIRLIDREVGQTPYYILKRYLDGPTAAFWQGVARLYKGNLKQPYDRFGEDRDLEELVTVWNAGLFDRLYFTIFGKPRPKLYFPEKYKPDWDFAQSPSK